MSLVTCVGVDPQASGGASVSVEQSAGLHKEGGCRAPHAGLIQPVMHSPNSPVRRGFFIADLSEALPPDDPRSANFNGPFETAAA